MKFTIAGAGALGCRFAYQLHKAGVDVTLIDSWPDHVEAIRNQGLMVDFNGTEEIVKLPIFYPAEAKEKADVVIVLTKAMQLDNMLNSIKDIFHNQTKVICLLNGLGHETVFQQYVPKENIIMGTTIWTAALNGPGKSYLHGIGSLELQSFTEADETIAIAKEIVALMDKAGLNAKYSEDVKTAIWKKACVNGCGNATTTLLECDLAGFFNHVYTRDIVTAITREFSQVAATQGVTLDTEAVSDFIITASRKVGAHHTSMYQDLVTNRRLTEIDYINGAVSRLGKENGIATPVCDLITQMIHIKESVLNAK